MNQHEMICLELQRFRSSFRFCRRLAELGGHCMSRNVALAAAKWRERTLEVAHKNVAMMSSSPVEVFDSSWKCVQKLLPFPVEMFDPSVVITCNYLILACRWLWGEIDVSLGLSAWDILSAGQMIFCGASQHDSSTTAPQSFGPLEGPHFLLLWLYWYYTGMIKDGIIYTYYIP